MRNRAQKLVSKAIAKDFLKHDKMGESEDIEFDPDDPLMKRQFDFYGRNIRLTENDRFKFLDDQVQAFQK